MISKIERLPESELRQGRLPSGRTPVELLEHLTYVELRWLEWGFEGRAITEPWGGNRWEGAIPATLERIVFHLLREYLRHLRHLDLVAELADGQRVHACRD